MIGYYTLSNASIHAAELPATITKRLPRYPVVLATLLRRLTVNERHRGAGWGTLLLPNVLRRSLRSEVASMAVLVDAKDEAAAAAYHRHDFLPLSDQSRRLFLPMADVDRLFGIPQLEEAKSYTGTPIAREYP